MTKNAEIMSNYSIKLRSIVIGALFSFILLGTSNVFANDFFTVTVDSVTAKAMELKKGSGTYIGTLDAKGNAVLLNRRYNDPEKANAKADRLNEEK